MSGGEWRESVPSFMNEDTLNWPLHKITEPHDLNDVILGLPEVHSPDNGSSDDNGSEEKEEPPIPWRSFLLSRRDHHHNDGWESLQGNQRFLKLLLQHQDEYEKRSQMEKPLLTVQILQQWRNQSPPGRFLVMESDTHPPLWKDVGDKKARAKISKAFKYLSKTHHGSASQMVGTPASLSLSSSNQESKDQTPNPTTAFIHEAEVNGMQPADPMQPGKSISISSITTTTSTTIQQEEKSGDVENPCCLGEKEAELSDSVRELPPVANIVRAEEGTKPAALLDISSSKMAKPPKLPARFQKPEKYTRRISEQLHSVQEGGTVIYGRQKEQEQLTTIYQRQKRQRALFQQEGSSSSCAVDLVFISGQQGVGKTYLANFLRNPLPLENHDTLDDDQDQEELENYSPFFLYGKFEHCQYSEPTAVFVSIATDFCQQLMQRGDWKLNQRYRDALTEALKDDLTVLTNLVPALDALMKKKNWSPDGFCKHHANDANNEESMDDINANDQIKEESQQDSYTCWAGQRIKEVFGLFLEAIASVDSERQSIIVLWDDIHWANEAAMDILISFMTNKASCGVLFLGTCRQDEADKPRMKAFLRLLNTNPHVSITNLQLENLNEDIVHCMLADALSLSEEETKSLAARTFSITEGNPTFITELLRGAQESGILQFHEATQQWTCDIEETPSCLGTISSFPDLLKAKVLSLPNAIQETLKIAACILSSHINESVMRMIDTVGALSSHLKYLGIRGFLTYQHGHYAFASDSVKEATYDLIPEKDRPSYHLRIAQRLWLHLEDHQTTTFYSILMGQIMMGDELIKEDADRRAVAALSLDAGRKAAKYLGFQTAWLCLSHGINIVSAQKTWGRDNYDLSLSLFNTAIEVCYCNGEFSKLEDLIGEVLDNARTFEDSLAARSTLIYAKGSRGLQLEAIEMGISTLSHLDETFPSTDPPKWRVYWEGRRVRNMLKGLSDEDILRLPTMKDPKKLAAMQILNHVILYANYARPTLSALISFRMVELTIRHGLSALSSVAFVMYGGILCRVDRVDDGFRYGKLSLKICDHFRKAVWLCRTWTGYYCMIHCRKLPIQSALEPLHTAEKAGLRAGDVEFSLLNASLTSFYSSRVSTLPVLEHDLRILAGRVLFHGQTLALVMIKPLWQMALNLMGNVKDPNILEGELIDDDDIAQARGGQNPHFMIWICFFQMKVSFLLGDYDKAEKFSHTTRYIYLNSSGCVDGAYTLFFESMTLLAQARRGKRWYRNLSYVRRRLKRLKYWALHAPTNFLGMQFLLEAEVAWLRGDRGKASSHYHSAILHSREAGFMAEEALANEQLGRYYIDLKDPDCAVPHLKAARELYKKWGATAVVERFEEEFCSFLEITS